MTDPISRSPFASSLSGNRAATDFPSGLTSELPGQSRRRSLAGPLQNISRPKTTDLRHGNYSLACSTKNHAVPGETQVQDNFPGLPIELIQEILSLSDLKDMAALARTNKINYMAFKGYLEPFFKRGTSKYNFDVDLFSRKIVQMLHIF